MRHGLAEAKSPNEKPMLKLFKIQLEEAFYSSSFPHFVLAEDIHQAWHLLTAETNEEPWILEQRDDGQYQTRYGRVQRKVTIAEIRLDQPQVLR